MMMVKLQHMQVLMTSGTRSSYGDANEESWGDDTGVKELKDPNLWDD